MMLGEHHHQPRSVLPTVQIPQWDPYSDDHSAIPLPSPFSDYPSLHRFLPSIADDDDDDSSAPDSDAFSCDHFRMFEFKIRRCARGRSHDWTECPFAHPGEKARRRDPRKHHYSGTACAEFRKGGCRRGDSCEFAHGVFECWLHPARYRTQPCKDGLSCRRRVCFFAHTPHQLRLLSPSASSSPPSDSPPESPLAASMRALHVSSPSSSSPPTSPWSYASPRSGSALHRPVFCGSPSTPPKVSVWDRGLVEEPAMERVESGRSLRARMYAKISKDNSVGRAAADSAGSGTPDVGWISELVN